MEYIIGFIFMTVLAAVYTIPALIIRGFVLNWLWLWFIVPLGVAPLSITHAVGISMIVGFLTFKDINCEDKRENGEKLTSSLLQTFVFPFIILAVAYLVKSFM